MGDWAFVNKVIKITKFECWKSFFVNGPHQYQQLCPKNQTDQKIPWNDTYFRIFRKHFWQLSNLWVNQWNKKDSLIIGKASKKFEQKKTTVIQISSSNVLLLMQDYAKQELLSRLRSVGIDHVTSAQCVTLFNLCISSNTISKARSYKVKSKQSLHAALKP